MKYAEIDAEGIRYIEARLGYALGFYGLDHANQLARLGATLDEIVEAFQLL